MKTTYNAASAAFRNFSKGFDEKIKFVNIRDTIQIFRNIQIQLINHETAIKAMVNSFNKYAEENKKDPKKVSIKKAKLEDSVEKANAKFELDINESDKRLIDIVLKNIRLKGDEDSVTLVDLERFLQDLNQ